MAVTYINGFYGNYRCIFTECKWPLLVIIEDNVSSSLLIGGNDVRKSEENCEDKTVAWKWWIFSNMLLKQRQYKGKQLLWTMI